jgi:hypothetical protein
MERASHWNASHTHTHTLRHTLMVVSTNFFCQVSSLILTQDQTIHFPDIMFGSYKQCQASLILCCFSLIIKNNTNTVWPEIYLTFPAEWLKSLKHPNQCEEVQKMDDFDAPLTFRCVAMSMRIWGRTVSNPFSVSVIQCFQRGTSWYRGSNFKLTVSPS